MLCAEFLEANYDKVFDQYQKLLNSENYVTRRQALKVPTTHRASLNNTLILPSSNRKLLLTVVRRTAA